MKNRVIITLCMSVWVFLLVAEGFTKKKKQTCASDSQKQEYAQVCAQVIQEFPNLLRACAAIHEQMTQDLQAVMEGNKQAFCIRATADQLKLCQDKLGALRVQMETLQQECLAYTTHVGRLGITP